MKHRLINTTRSLTLRALAMTGRYVNPPAARPAAPDLPKEVPPRMPSLSGEVALRRLEQAGRRDSPSAALAAARYKVKARKGGGYEASNPKQNFRIVFTSEGVEVRGLSPARPGWRLGMRLAACGYGKRKTPVTALSLKAEGERVEYELRSRDGAGLSEWYLNRAEGLEHGFTVPQAPGKRRDGEKLSLWVSLSGDLKAQLAEEGRAILLDGREAGVALRYDSLHAYDATGRELPARIRLSGGGAKLEVADEGAVYPVTIDPTLWVKMSYGNSLKLEVQEEEVHPLAIAPTLSQKANPIIVNPPDPVWPDGMVGQPYNFTFTASGGTAPYTFTVDGGSLPTGLTLAADGTLSGTPIAMGTFNFVVQAIDAEGAYGGRYYTLSIKAAVVVIPTNPLLPGGAVGQPYNRTFTASGGAAPYTFAVADGTLPPGLTLAADGTLSGTPTAEGTFNFRVQARDSVGASGWRDYALNIKAPIIVTPPNLQDAIVGQLYSQSFQAQGGTAPYTFSLSAGSLPPGLRLAPDGTLTGSAVFPGTYTFTIRATDADGLYGERQYTLIVKASLTT